jgi:pentatricopeptide repeat protein
MATRIIHTSVLRRPLRPDFWNLASRIRTLALHRGLTTISLPYSESPSITVPEHSPDSSTVSLDPSVFEVDSEEEYQTIASSHKPLSLQAAVSSPDRSSLVLIRLIEEYRYEDANRVRSEMSQMDSEITASPVFEQAALAALTMEGDREYRLTNFLGWLTLIPRRDRELSLPKFDRFLRPLLEGRTPDIEFITQFAVVCVSKGYTQTFPQRIIPFVIRFAEPSVGLAFLEELHAAALRYDRHNNKHRRMKTRQWFNQAIRGYASAHRLPQAVRALQLALTYGVNPTDFTYRFLLHHLKSKEHDFPEALEYVTSLYQSQKASESLSSQPLPKTTDTTSDQVDPFDYRFHCSLSSDLVGELRRLWRAIGTDQHPPAVSLAQFLELYISTCDSIRGIQLLRRKAHRAGNRYRAHWAMVEMLYYGKRKQWRQLLSTFDDCFYSVGVPDEIHKYKKPPAEQNQRNLRRTRGLQARIFPNITHTCLVWRALVEITDGTPEFDAIYRRLILHVEAPGASSYPSSSSQETIRSATLPPPCQAFDAAHFTAFIYSLFRKAKTSQMRAVFSDMYRLGIEPTLPQLALLAGAHAIHSDYDGTLALLDLVDERLHVDRLTQAADDTISPEDFQKFLVLYLPSFSGFLYRNHIRGASVIKDRLFKYGYVKGSNELVEANLVWFDRIKTWAEKNSFVVRQITMIKWTGYIHRFYIRPDKKNVGSLISPAWRVAKPDEPCGSYTSS